MYLSHNDIHNKLFFLLVFFVSLIASVTTLANPPEPGLSITPGSEAIIAFSSEYTEAEKEAVSKRIRTTIANGGLLDSIEWKDSSSCKIAATVAASVTVLAAAVIFGSINLTVLKLSENECSTLFTQPNPIKIGAMAGTAPLMYQTLQDLGAYIKTFPQKARDVKLFFLSKTDNDAETGSDGAAALSGTNDQSRCCDKAPQLFQYFVTRALAIGFAGLFAINDSLNAAKAGSCLTSGQTWGTIVFGAGNFLSTFSVGLLCSFTLVKIIHDHWGGKNTYEGQIDHAANDAVNLIRENRYTDEAFQTILEKNNLNSLCDVNEILAHVNTDSDPSPSCCSNLAFNIAYLGAATFTSIIGGLSMKNSFSSQAVVSQATELGIIFNNSMVSFNNTVTGTITTCNSLVPGSMITIPSDILATISDRTLLAQLASIAQGAGLAVVIVHNTLKWKQIIQQLLDPEKRKLFFSQPKSAICAQILGPLGMSICLTPYLINIWSANGPALLQSAFETCTASPWMYLNPHPTLATIISMAILAGAFIEGQSTITSGLSKVFKLPGAFQRFLQSEISSKRKQPEDSSDAEAIPLNKIPRHSS
ncbi:hypothetical protein N9V90_02275 [Endozoicomonas sp.]|nr:hypothetical protein [Endozoicomonas sp.]